MKSYQLLILLFAVMLLTPSCSRTNEQLLQAGQLIETAPDSAMAILNKYNYNKLSDKDKALYGLVYIQMRDKKFLSLEPDSLLDFSIKYYLESHNEHVRLATCYLYKGRKFKNSLQYEDAMQYYMLSLDLLNDEENDVLKGHVNLDLGAIYNIQRDYLKAREKFWLSYKQYIDSRKYKFAFYCILYIGRTYNEEKKYDEALIFYKKHKIIAKDSIEQAVLLQEIALNYYDKVELDSAKYYLKKILYYPYIRNNRAFRFALLADLYFDIKKIDSARIYALDAFKFQPDIRTKLNCYRILVNCSSLKNNQSDLKLYMSKYQQCDDSIRHIDSQTKGSYIETMHNTQREVAKSHSWIWYLSIFVLMIIIVSVMLYLRKHKKSVLEMKMAGEYQLKQKAELRHEVVNKSRQAVETTIRERRNEMMAKNKNSNPEFRRKLINRLYGEVIHFKDKTYFKKEMDAIMNNLYSKLESRYPELNEKEVQWACLYELNVSRDDIMDLLDFKLESYKKMRQRFAQKTGVNYIKSIDELLEKILTE